VAGNLPLDIPDVFSTYLYEGNQTDRTITNGINLSEEGGLVWIKEREAVGNHFLFDTERPLEYSLQSNETDAQSFRDETVEAYNTDGFDLGTGTNCNQSNIDFVSWTWRKAPKFFDIVTYTGDGVAGREISHSLNSEVGLILVKQTNTAAGWYVLHKDSGLLILHETVGQYSDAITDGFFGDGSTLIRPTSSVFTLGDNVNVNGSGNTYVAYLFAHNDNGDGEFGPDGDADIIKCGSYTGGGSSTVEVDLGFEPQWLLVKNIETDFTEWVLLDNMRGLPLAYNTNAMRKLQANTNSAEGGDYCVIQPMPTGFRVGDGIRTVGDLNTSGNTYIYMAIRRGPLSVPESATDVFDIYQNESTATVPAFKHPFPVDFAFYKAASNTEDWWYSSRLTQEQNYRLNVQTYSGGSSSYAFDYMDGWLTSSTTQTDYYSWAWKRAPNFFDVVTYSGTNSVQNVPHNLGVAPKLMIIRMIQQNAPPAVYWEPAGNTENYFLTSTSNTDNSQLWNSTTPTDSVFTVKGPLGDVNYSGYNYQALLFGELDGISKIGSYVGNGSTQNIDCGFTSGARLVLIKGSTSGDWILFDAERGIVAGDDPYLRLNSASAQITNKDYIDAYSSGFTVKTDVSTIVNANGTTYYFYAIA
jgi:hypothetical protein